MPDNPQALLPKPQLPVVSLPGSQPLSNVRHEHYCRLRPLLWPKAQALREAGTRAVKNHDAVSNATRLERRQDVRDRIAFLVRQEEEGQPDENWVRFVRAWRSSTSGHDCFAVLFGA
jgi:hypothetical protein